MVSVLKPASTKDSLIAEMIFCHSTPRKPSMAKKQTLLPEEAIICSTKLLTNLQMALIPTIMDFAHSSGISGRLSPVSSFGFKSESFPPQCASYLPYFLSVSSIAKKLRAQGCYIPDPKIIYVFGINKIRC